MSGLAGRVRDALLAVVAAALIENALFQHVPRSVAAQGYTLGLFSALLLALPFSVYFLWRSYTDHRVGLAGFLAAPALAAGLLIVR